MNDIVVVFNSRADATGTNRNELTYNYDWSKLKDAYYEVSFTLLMERGTWEGTKLPMVYIDSGNNPQVFRTTAETASQTTTFIGVLKFHVLQGASAQHSYCYAGETDNPHIHLTGRPTNPRPVITFRDGTGALLTDNAGAEIGHYIMNVRFTEIHYNLKEHRDRYA